MSLHDLRPALANRQADWILGMALGTMSYGALLTLSISCIDYLRNHPSQPSVGNNFLTQHRALQCHVTLVLIFNTVLQAKNMQQFLGAVFYTDPDKLTYFYWGPFNTFVGLLVMLTDGLLIWRCYMVQKALFRHRPAGLHHICWVFPLCLLFSTMVLGFTSFTTFNPNTFISDGLPRLGMILLCCTLLGNIILNIFATSNIIIRLLYHRYRMRKTVSGSDSAGNYQLHITGILLESAALNIPVTIFGALAIYQKALYAEMVMQIAVPLQSIASILVTHQVAKGRDVYSKTAHNERDNQN